MHDLADEVHLLMVKTAVMDERHGAIVVQLDRIETTIGKVADKTDGHSLLLNTLFTRADEAKKSGAKWGGLIGGLIAGAAAVWQVVMGPK